MAEELRQQIRALGPANVAAWVRQRRLVSKSPNCKSLLKLCTKRVVQQPEYFASLPNELFPTLPTELLNRLVNKLTKFYMGSDRELDPASYALGRRLLESGRVTELDLSPVWVFQHKATLDLVIDLIPGNCHRLELMKFEKFLDGWDNYSFKPNDQWTHLRNLKELWMSGVKLDSIQSFLSALRLFPHLRALGCWVSTEDFEPALLLLGELKQLQKVFIEEGNRHDLRLRAAQVVQMVAQLPELRELCSPYLLGFRRAGERFVEGVGAVLEDRKHRLLVDVLTINPDRLRCRWPDKLGVKQLKVLRASTQESLQRLETLSPVGLHTLKLVQLGPEAIVHLVRQLGAEITDLLLSCTASDSYDIYGPRANTLEHWRGSLDLLHVLAATPNLIYFTYVSLLPVAAASVQRLKQASLPSQLHHFWIWDRMRTLNITEYSNISPLFEYYIATTKNDETLYIYEAEPLMAAARDALRKDHNCCSTLKHLRLNRAKYDSPLLDVTIEVVILIVLRSPSL